MNSKHLLTLPDDVLLSPSHYLSLLYEYLDHHFDPRSDNHFDLHSDCRYNHLCSRRQPIQTTNLSPISSQGYNWVYFFKDGNHISSFFIFWYEFSVSYTIFKLKKMP
ncbi:hypothetical protein RND81_12G039300 [Saponaria officinalis]|uniref:Uncharacterized protein n=1 Tax=Saponaria officinalis TaxID=3572 RepID=A0AAW1H2Y5_SAPOF